MIRFRTLVLALPAALSASFLLARVHPFGDASLYSSASRAPIMQHSNVPPAVRDLLTAKCADCHSTLTRTPFYGRLAPISWLLERDIIQGRQHMNLSAWDSYTADQQQTLQAKIFQQVRTGKMPLPQYRAIHRDSVITPADLALLAQWTHPSPLEITSAQPDPPSQTSKAQNTEGNATQGKLVFEKRCTGCHSLDQNREGPRLAGVFGRPSAQISGFNYSAALRGANITWNETTLDRWLTDPDAYVPGNDMSFRVTNPQERHDLIRFLQENSVK